MRRSHCRDGLLAICLAAAALTAGCETMQDWFKTDEDRVLGADIMVRHPKRPRITGIKIAISPADDRRELPLNGTPPTDEDATYREVEYQIGPTDLLDITVMDLLSVGVETALRREVSDAGNIDLPLLPDRIHAAGMTQDQLKNKIVSEYKRNQILRDAVVAVLVSSRRQNLVTVLGAVLRTGTYNIVRKDMRMLEALGLAGDVLSPTCKYIFLIRPSPAIREEGEANA